MGLCLSIVPRIACTKTIIQKQTDKDPQREQSSQQQPEGVMVQPSMSGEIPPIPQPSTS